MSSVRASTFRRFVRRWFNWLVLATMAAAILGTIALLLSTGAAERAERAQVERAGEILRMLDRIERGAVSAESAQRGYFITFDPRYIARYHAGREATERALDDLRTALREDSSLGNRVQTTAIERALDDKFTELGEAMRLLEDRELREARRRILEGDDYDAMQRLRDATDELSAIENRLLDDQSERARVAEARIVPILGALLLLLIGAIALGARLVARAAQAETEAAQSRELEAARDRADLLAQELNHRVKNLFAMVLAIVQMTSREAAGLPAFKERLEARIRALLTAHEVTQGQGTGADRLLRDSGVSLHALVEASVEPHRSEDKQLELSSEDLTIDRGQVTPLGLVLHELATNAVKYGCWQDAGLLAVRWRTESGNVHLDWIERSATPQNQSEREGFGSKLMTGAARQLGGEIERTFGSDGVTVSITFPASATLRTAQAEA